MSTSGTSRTGGLPSHETIGTAMHSVVQIVALRQGFLGGMSPAWTGSGSIVDPSGVILTNCHVANPRAMGMSAPPADRLGIAITEHSDQAPVLTYFADVVVQSPEVDLAVLRIVATVDGKRVSNLNLPYVPVGNSDELDLGDTLCILGYPGIGGETVTFTSGSVSGFTQESNLRTARAWIKTDATIAGGNSGGMTINSAGELVGVPTQASAGSGVTPVDARPVVDTNQDGRIDERDTPMAIGGFINGLRPVALAIPLLQKAGVRVESRGAQVQVPTTPAPAPSSAVQPSGQQASGPTFRTLVFSRGVASDGRPINPASILPSGGKELYATFEYAGMQNGMSWNQVWAVNGQQIVSKPDRWEAGTQGRRTLSLTNSKGLPDGQYHLVLTVENRVLAEATAVVGRRAEDTDTEISGRIIDQATRRGIPGALVIVLRPEVKVQDFVREQRREMAFTSARTDNNGQFTFPQQLPKGQAYGLIVVGRGYRDLAIESALRITANAPEQAQLGDIGLQQG
jgi:serine protease Do